VKYEVHPTGVVEWQESGDSSGYALVLLPLLWLINLLVWLVHCAVGRGYTLHIFDEKDRRLARERHPTRQAAEAALHRRQAYDQDSTTDKA